MCYLSCLSRFYGDPLSLICKSCAYDCLTCNSLGHCLTCDVVNDHRVLNESTYRCIPIVGYFDNGTTVSIQCPLGCLSCQDSLKCNGCKSGFFMRGDNRCY